MHAPNPMLPQLPRGVQSIQETAEQLTASVSFVRNEIKLKRLPVVRLGRRVVIRAADVEAYLHRLAAASVAGSDTPVAPAITDQPTAAADASP